MRFSVENYRTTSNRKRVGEGGMHPRNGDQKSVISKEKRRRMGFLKT